MEGEGGGCLQADNTLNHRWVEQDCKRVREQRQTERERETGEKKKGESKTEKEAEWEASFFLVVLPQQLRE